MAPTIEYLDGPSNVMPRPDADFRYATYDQNATSTALTLRWQDPGVTARIKDLVGHYWYGRATPA